MGSAVRILGIDPGSQATGYGIIDHDGRSAVHVAHGTLRPPRNLSSAGRLASIAQGLRQVIAAHTPDVAVVECVFVANSPRSALVLGQVRGVALATAAEAGVAVAEYAASEIKKAVVGTGNAQKGQVQAMVKRLLGLAALPGSDAADALAAAICHANAGRLAALAPGPARRSRSRGRARRGPGLVVRRVR